MPEPLTNDLPTIIGAIGALGTAAYGLVDACKALPFGGPSRHGFGVIKKLVKRLIPIEAESFPRRADILNTLSSNWINGTAVDVQKAIAKSLLRLALNPTNAATFATATGLPAVKVGDKEVSLVTISQKQVDGQSLDDAENGLNGRFDLVLSALLDAAYQKADQRYRNNAKAWATVVSVALSLGGCYILGRSTQSDLVQAVLLGLIATPLAPLAKDLSTAVVAATQMIKSTKR